MGPGGALSSDAVVAMAGVAGAEFEVKVDDGSDICWLAMDWKSDSRLFGEDEEDLGWFAGFMVNS